MTRRDYIALALALKSATPLASDGEAAMRAWRGAVFAIANELARDNPRFDRPRFVAAAMGAL